MGQRDGLREGKGLREGEVKGGEGLREGEKSKGSRGRIEEMGQSEGSRNGSQRGEKSKPRR